jgi:SAM-dependent methyltransferase
MDRATLAAYESAAAAYAKRWLDQEEPANLYALFRRYFRPALTADIGCGSGREAGWLNANGFPTIGYDASEALLAQARARYPQVEFAMATLPELRGIPARHFDNVCCETVIMHLPLHEIVPAVSRMMAVLKTGGVLYLSWRMTRGADRRDEKGRLYTAFDNDLVRGALADWAILFEDNVGREVGGDVHRLVARAA